jgi:NAD+ diphosphatase
MQWSGLRALFGAIDDSLFAIAGRAFQIVDWDRSHQFCGRCGTPTQIKSNERARECPNCKQVHYPRIAPAIMALVRRGSELLLARSPHFAPGMYSALAGFVEPGETLEQTLVREVREEVGIEVTNVRYFASQPWPFPHSLMIAFNADYAGGEITPEPGEIEAADWFTLDRLPQALPSKISISRRLIDAALADLGASR